MANQRLTGSGVGGGGVNLVNGGFSSARKDSSSGPGVAVRSSDLNSIKAGGGGRHGTTATHTDFSRVSQFSLSGVTGGAGGGGGGVERDMDKRSDNGQRRYY